MYRLTNIYIYHVVLCHCASIGGSFGIVCEVGGNDCDIRSRPKKDARLPPSLFDDSLYLLTTNFGENVLILYKLVQNRRFYVRIKPLRAAMREKLEKWVNG